MRNRPSSLWFAAGGLMLGTAAIGMAPIFVRWSEVGPVATAFWRLFLATALVGLAAAVRGEVRPFVPTVGEAPWLLKALIAGVAFGGDLGVWHLSVKMTTVANATLLANLAPIFLLIFARLFLRERIRGLVWGAIALSFTGALLLLGSSVSLQLSRGDLFGLVAAVFYSIYLLFLRQIPRQVPSLWVLGTSSAIGAVVLLPFTNWLEPDFIPRTARGWEVVLALALVAQCLGQGLITRNLPRLPVSLSSAILVCQSAFAAFFGWWLLGEALTPLRAFGALLMIFGIFLVRVLGMAQRPRADMIPKRAPRSAKTG